MILNVVKYGASVLRQPGVSVEAITPEIDKLVADMFETMYASKGIGLAAQQVGVAKRITVIDVRGITDRPSTLELDNLPADVERFMPLTLINARITPMGESVAGPEGCLSFPDIYADIVRPEMVEVVALDRRGRQIQFRCGGLLARAVQHEVDHLNGVLFIDRMDRKTKDSLREELQLLREETLAQAVAK